MNRSVRFTVQAALVAAMYVALTYLQNFLIPGSATWAIQFRVSEALCVLAMFTPAAVPGLAVGCFLFNISYAGALPLDFAIGTLATVVATQGMRWLRKYPWVAFSLPAVSNALLVGWELTCYVGGGFWLNALLVAVGELGVLYTLGAALYMVMKSHRSRLFG